MTRKEAARILKLHQEWRLGKPPYDKAGTPMPHTPKELTTAIFYAIESLSHLEQLIAAAEPAQKLLAAHATASKNDEELAAAAKLYKAIQGN